MKVEGKITSATGASIGAFISAYDKASGQRVFSGKPLPDGSYELYLLEGRVYELAVDPEQDHVTFFSKSIDLTSDRIPQSEKLDIVLKPVQAGDEIDLSGVRFKPQSSELDHAAEADLKRLARMVKAATDLKVELQVLLTGYQEDSVQSSPDLTEITVDSIQSQIEMLDSAGQATMVDTIVVRTIYHNDRTEHQALSVMNFLLSEGVPSDRLLYFVNARPEAIEEKRGVLVKARLLK
ncbi:MAG: hypothetical protein HC859_01430 [Bacteroidia bacterium]|nr:hypothetical protein [Bacteroidia bacterium]